MSSKRRLRRKQCGKHSFPDEKSAVEACIIARKQRGQQLHPYRCVFCSSFHIGHLPSQAKKAKSAAINARRGVTQ